MISERTRTIVIGVVTFFWALNVGAGIVAQILEKDFAPDASIHAVFMLVVGAMFAIKPQGAYSGDKKPPEGAGPPGGSSDSPDPAKPSDNGSEGGGGT